MADLPAGQKMWIAHADEIEAVEVVAKGVGRRVLKDRVKIPYLVKDEDGEEFVVGLEDLCDSRMCARRKQFQLRVELGVEDEDDDDEEDDDFDEEDDE